MNADRHYAVASILFDYLKSPSLRHLREPHSVHKVSREIVKALDGASSVWKKWESQREEVAQAAAPCWIPVECHSACNIDPLSRGIGVQN
jgi:hypothetical protein